MSRRQASVVEGAPEMSPEEWASVQAQLDLFHSVPPAAVWTIEDLYKGASARVASGVLVTALTAGVVGVGSASAKAEAAPVAQVAAAGMVPGRAPASPVINRPASASRTAAYYPPAGTVIEEIPMPRGGTVEREARNDGISEAEWLSLNPSVTDPHWVYAGEKYKEVIKDTPAKPKPLAPAQRLAGATEKPSDTIVYDVKAGDNPWQIAVDHHKSLTELEAANPKADLSRGFILPGQKLSIPESILRGGVVHTVAPGQNFDTILQQNGVDPTPANRARIAHQSGITDPSVIYPGQAIVIAPPQLAPKTVVPYNAHHHPDIKKALPLPQAHSMHIAVPTEPPAYTTPLQRATPAAHPSAAAIEQHNQATPPAADINNAALTAAFQAMMDVKMGILPLTTVRNGNGNTWPGSADQLANIVATAIARHNDPDGVTELEAGSQLFAESGGRPKAGSDAGAEGIAQFLPKTFKSYGRAIDHNGSASPYDPVDAIDAQVSMMDDLMDLVRTKYPDASEQDCWHMALAAYNAGPGLFKQIGAAEMTKYGQTVGYIANNSKYLAIMNQAAAAASQSSSQSSATPSTAPTTPTTTPAPVASTIAPTSSGQLIGGMRTPVQNTPSQTITPEVSPLPHSTPPVLAQPAAPDQPALSLPSMRTPSNNTSTSSLATPTNADASSLFPTSLHGAAQFSQHQAPWGSEMYSITNDPEQTISTSGCEPTDMTSAVDTLTDAAVTPPVLAQEAIAGGFRTRNAGTQAGAVPYQAHIYGLTATPVTSEAQISQALANNSDASVTEEVIISGHDVSDLADRVTPFTSSGHYIELTQNAADGAVLVNDPNSTANSEKPWSLDQIWAHHNNAFVIKK